MKRTLAVVLLLGLVSPAHADERTTWKVVLGTSIGMTLVGGYFAYDGWSDVQREHDLQCDHGAAPPGVTGCTLQPGLSQWTQAEVDASNDRGDRAATRSQVGWIVTGAGMAVAGVAVYKLLTIKDPDKDRVTFAPTVNKGGGGAALTLRF